MFQSKRIFRLWDYRVSHDQLLLRSAQTPDIQTNVDIVFWGVEYIVLPTMLHGLLIRKGTIHDVKNIPIVNPIRDSVFIIETIGCSFFVAALGCKVLENQLDIFESSLEMFSIKEPQRDIGNILMQL